MAKKKQTQKIKRRRATFSLEAPDAGEVFLMGDFNQWDPKKHPMKKDEKGVWKKAVMIPPGTYEYKFKVDGRWRMDPQNENRCQNRFGTYNNLLNLSPK
ncbi:glycogen-binding domain-containing protein [Thermodesulfobacteriota bacterium]